MVKLAATGAVLAALILTAFVAYYYGYRSAASLSVSTQPSSVPLASSAAQAGDASIENQGTAASNSCNGVDPKIVEVLGDIVGSWRSADNQTIRREFMGDSTVVDHFATPAGAVTSSSTWSLFIGSPPTPEPFSTDPGVVYLQITHGDEASDYFDITELTENELQLVNMETGSTTNFVRLACTTQ
jgi:hypothetical protein